MIPHAIAGCVGIWLMAAPAVLGFGGAAATNAQIVGPLIATFGMVALAESTRGVRWVNVALGGWMMLSALVFTAPAPARAAALTAGAAVVGLSLMRGALHNKYAGGWAILWRGYKQPRLKR